MKLDVTASFFLSLLFSKQFVFMYIVYVLERVWVWGGRCVRVLVSTPEAA